jgi:hypothetical protein
VIRVVSGSIATSGKLTYYYIITIFSSEPKQTKEIRILQPANRCLVITNEEYKSLIN